MLDRLNKHNNDVTLQDVDVDVAIGSLHHWCLQVDDEWIINV
jgi:hypothetical protein